MGAPTGDTRRFFSFLGMPLRRGVMTETPACDAPKPGGSKLRAQRVRVVMSE